MTADHSTRATVRVLDVLFDDHAHSIVDVRNESDVSETTVREHLELLHHRGLASHTDAIPHAYYWNPALPTKRTTREFAADLYALVDAFVGNGIKHRDAMLRALRAVAQETMPPSSSRRAARPMGRNKGAN